MQGGSLGSINTNQRQNYKGYCDIKNTLKICQEPLFNKYSGTVEVHPLIPLVHYSALRYLSVMMSFIAFSVEIIPLNFALSINIKVN